MSKRIVQRGHHVTLAVASPRNRDPGIISKEVEGVRILEYGVPFPGNLVENAMRSYREIRDIARVVRETDYDLIQVHAVAALEMGIPAAYSVISKSAPLVVAWDDLWGREGMARDSFGKGMWAMYTLLEDLVTSMADRVMVPNEGLRIRALNLGIKEARIFKLYVGTDVEHIMPLDKSFARKKTGIDTGFALLYLGGSYDNFETRRFLLRALHKMKEQIPDVKIIMTRPQGGDSGHLQAEAAALGLTESLVDVGSVPYEDLPYVLASADVTTLPLFDNGVDRLRYPGRFADMLAAGRPILVSDVGELKTIVAEGACGSVFRAGDPKDFASKAYSLWRHKEATEEMGRNARKLALARFQWDQITEELERVYTRLLEERR